MRKTLLPATIMSVMMVLTACGKPAESQHEVPLPTVRLFQIAENGSIISRDFIGRVEALSTVDLAFQVSGQLQEFPVQQGQIIPAGQLIAALDPAPYQASVEQAEVQLKLASRELERGRPLRERGILTPSDFDQLQTNFDIATVNLDNARRNLGYTRIDAPFDALVTRRLIERFSTLQAGTTIVRLQDVTELRVSISVPEHMIQDINRSGITEIYAQLSEADTRRYPLSYREHVTEINPVTQTYQLWLVMPRPEDVNLLPGMTLIVKTESENTAAANVAIPVSALDTSVAQSFRIWLFDPQTGQVNPVAVEVGKIESNTVQIIKGLKGGEQIVSSGIYHLQPGQRVQPFDKY